MKCYNNLILKFFCISILYCSNINAQNQIIGSESFIHLKKIDNVWWFVDAAGEKFISTGMNHIQSNIRFADYNKKYWSKNLEKKFLKMGITMEKLPMQ